MSMQAGAVLAWIYNYPVTQDKLHDELLDCEGCVKGVKEVTTFFEYYEGCPAYLGIDISSQTFSSGRPGKLNLWKIDSVHPQTATEWNGLLKQACEKLDIPWDSSKAGWWVICQYG